MKRLFRFTLALSLFILTLNVVTSVQAAPGADANFSVVSVTRVDASPTNAASVYFTVTFSEDVQGVDTSDFTADGILGASVTGVALVSASQYTVTVAPNGEGTLGLTVIGDGSGNIQNMSSEPLLTRYSSGETYVIDVTKPTVSAFTAASSSSSLDVPISAFSANDTVGVAGYKITASSTPPGAGDADWSATPPTAYTVPGAGSYSLYPWAKDAAGNVSDAYGTPAAVDVCLASIIVASNADSGAGTLRQAMTDLCSGGTITFDASLAGKTITLASMLTIGKNMTIDGSALARQIIISGNKTTRVFTVNLGATAALNNLTIANGKATLSAGGGIENLGTLTVTNSTFSGNSAPNSDGGSIANEATLTVINSAFIGNLAFYGGGIKNNGTLTVANSTFSGNSGTTEGGGLYNMGTSTTVTNSTFVGNSSQYGGGFASNGGIFKNVISAHNLTGMDCYGSVAIFNSLIENPETDRTENCNKITNGVNGNIVGVGPTLGTLASNGGPTQTFALLAGSPAIDAGNDTACAAAPVNRVDGRGIARPQGAHCDMGAYELEQKITSTQTIGNGMTRNFAAGSTGIGITIKDAPGGGAPGPTTVTLYTIRPAGIPFVAGQLPFWVNIVPTVNINLNESLTLCYPASLLPTGTGEANLVFFHYESSRWVRVGFDSRNTTTHCVTKNNISSFSMWTLAPAYLAILSSIGADDGWILESSETSSVGGTMNRVENVFFVGADALQKQYRSVLSFATGVALPDTATITKVTLKVKFQQIVNNTLDPNPVHAFGGFMVDVRNGFFGSLSTLQITDFQEVSNKTCGPFMTTLVDNWYSIDLTCAGPFINKLATNSGLTQFRLRFKLGNNNIRTPIYLILYSGDAPAANAPQLIIEYKLP